MLSVAPVAATLAPVTSQLSTLGYDDLGDLAGSCWNDNCDAEETAEEPEPQGPDYAAEFPRSCEW